MWIRSQNKLTLEQIKSIAIRVVVDGETNETRRVKGWSIITLNPSTYSELGIYETEERAIEVLDEIQKSLLENLSFGMTSNNKIYQMPEK